MASLERPCFLWAQGWLHICYPPDWCVPGDLNYWSCSIPQIMTTLNTGSRPHRPINTGTVWSRGRKLETVTFQMDTYLYEAFVRPGKRTWSAISQVCEDCVFLRLQLRQSGQMTSRCGPQEIAHRGLKGSRPLLNRWCQIVKCEHGLECPLFFSDNPVGN